MIEDADGNRIDPRKKQKQEPRKGQFQKGYDARREGRRDINEIATPESRAKGLAVIRQNKIERAKSYRDRLSDKLQERVDADFEAMRDAWLNGDTAAYFKMVEQAFGKPHQSVALSGEEGPLQIVVRSAFDVGGDDSGAAVSGELETKRLGEGVG